MDLEIDTIEILEDSQIMLRLPPYLEDMASSQDDHTYADNGHNGDFGTSDDQVATTPRLSVNDLLTSIRTECGDSDLYVSVLTNALDRARPLGAGAPPLRPPTDPPPRVRIGEGVKQNYRCFTEVSRNRMSS